MPKKMDSLKISIDNSGEAKKVKKKALVLKTKVQPSKKSKSILSPVIAVIVTAIIVGGGIYAWKDKEVERGLKDISQNARTTREEFENRINNLKNKITGIESENIDLKTAKEELEKKISYLNGATKQYSNEEIGFSFLYPASFGEVVIKSDKVADGIKLTGIFSENAKLVFTSVDSDYFVKDLSKALSLCDNYGFNEDKDKVIYKFAIKDGVNEFEIHPIKKISIKDSEAILVDKKSFPVKDDIPQVDLGENVGAVVNLKNDKNPSLVFVNSDFSLMTLIDFETMIATVESK